MKRQFDEADKIEAFREAINCEAKLLCNVDDAFSQEKASDLLEQLTKSWRMDEDNVIKITLVRVQNTIDKRLLNYVLRFMDLEKIQYTEQEIRQELGTLSAAEKCEVVDGIVDYLNNRKRSNFCGDGQEGE